MKFLALYMNNHEVVEGSLSTVTNLVSVAEEFEYGLLGHQDLFEFEDHFIELLYAEGVLREGADKLSNPFAKKLGAGAHVNCCVVAFDNDYNMIDLSEDDLKMLERLLDE